ARRQSRPAPGCPRAEAWLLAARVELVGEEPRVVDDAHRLRGMVSPGHDLLAAAQEDLADRGPVFCGQDRIEPVEWSSCPSVRSLLCHLELEAPSLRCIR